MGSALRLAAFALLAWAPGARAQDAFFKEPAQTWWRPTWELEARTDRTTFSDSRPDLDRQNVRLRLRWSLGEDGGWWGFGFGSAHRAGSDGNRFNLPRFDNESSNGNSLDLAELRLQGSWERGGLSMRGGLVENDLLSAESLWDPDLRVIGGGARAFLRTPGGMVEEAGIRVVAGDARLIAGGRVTLRAVQAVLRLQTGPIAWTAFGGPWNLQARQEDALNFRRQNPVSAPGNPYYVPGGYADPEFRFTVVGASIQFLGIVPVELKAIKHSNLDYPDWGGEFQAWVGSRTRRWWPQLGYIRQRLDPAGALASVNGDLWWLHANGDGQRYVLALGLPARWSASWTYVEQSRRGGTLRFTRSIIGVQKRF